MFCSHFSLKIRKYRKTNKPPRSQNLCEEMAGSVRYQTGDTILLKVVG